MESRTSLVGLPGFVPTRSKCPSVYFGGTLGRLRGKVVVGRDDDICSSKLNRRQEKEEGEEHRISRQQPGQLVLQSVFVGQESINVEISMGKMSEFLKHKVKGIKIHF